MIVIKHVHSKLLSSELMKNQMVCPFTNTDIIVVWVRYDHYIDLVGHTFWRTLWPWMVLPQQMIVQVGVNIVYMVTGGTCPQKLMQMVCTHSTRLRDSY